MRENVRGLVERCDFRLDYDERGFLFFLFSFFSIWECLNFNYIDTDLLALRITCGDGLEYLTNAHDLIQILEDLVVVQLL